jgi:hypothetical protein
MPDNEETFDVTIADQDAKYFIKAAVAKIQAKAERYQKFNEYYFGKHPFNFASEKFTTEFARRLQSFRDNLCPTVVKAPADRLEVIGFAADQKSDVYKQSWDLWLYSRMKKDAKKIHRDAFRTSDAFVVVWPDSTGRSRIYHQEPGTCSVWYDQENGTIEAGAKLWRGADGYVYLTLYYPDRIEKYISKAKQSAGTVPGTSTGYEKRIVQGEPWPLPNPAGSVVLFHFGLETSILNDVIPLNDALNKTLADLLVSSESNSIRQRWATGISFEVNPETGKQIIPFEGVSDWFASNDDATKFGSFADANLKDFIEMANDFRNEIASVAGIPHYYFRLDGGSLPSGEALRKAESRFTSIISDAQLDFGDTWSGVMKVALQLDSKSSIQEDDASTLLETQWKPADPMSTTELANVAVIKKNVGVSDEQNLSELGYTDDQIKKMKGENDAKSQKAADAFSKTFNAGPQVG